ncbi:MAG: hypothetical protein HDR01_16285 [Lachnospiraceae bacterium]|nr:hypothetical protein [Lachnospiraceae bacterium]
MKDEMWITTWSYAQRRTSFTRWENQDSFQIDIPNNIWGHAIKLKFSNWYGTRSIGIKEVNFSLKGHTYSVFVKEQQEFQVMPTRDIYSDTVFVELVPGDIIRISVTFVNQLRPESGNTFQNGIAMIFQSVLVATSNKADVIAFFGDSITHRQKWSKPLIHNWYAKYPGRLAAFEVAVDGSRLLNDSPKADDETLGFRAAKRFQHDILENTGINYVVFALGLNDLAIEEGKHELTLESYANAVEEIVKAAHKKDIKVIGLTITPRQINEFYTSEKNHLRKAINQWILQNSPFDAAVDIAALVTNENDTALKTEYSDIDGVHISQEAGRVIAEALEKERIFEWC